MKIAFLTHSLSGGGAEAVCRAWAEGLADRGHDITVFVLDGLSTGEDVAGTAPGGTCFAEEQGVHGHVARVLWFRRHLSNGNFDVAVSLQTYPNLVALIARLFAGGEVATAISEHNIPSILLNKEGAAKHAQLRLARRLYRTAERVVAVSHAVATDLRCNFHIDPEKLSVLPNPVLVKRRAQAAPLAPGRSLRLLVAARVAPQKRPQRCIDVLDALHERGVAAELVWVGDLSGRYRDDPLLAADRPDITRADWTPDWYKFANDRTVLLLTSDYEGFGNVLVESAAHGIPVVAGSHALGCSDAVIPGVTGYLASADDVESYASAVLEASRLEVHLTPRGWFDRFSTASVAGQLENVLLAATGTRGRAELPEQPSTRTEF